FAIKHSRTHNMEGKEKESGVSTSQCITNAEGSKKKKKKTTILYWGGKKAVTTRQIIQQHGKLCNNTMILFERRGEIFLNKCR
ncbi:hypothetical protein J1N35_029175, partial [Gossypium stocksii]